MLDILRVVCDGTREEGRCWCLKRMKVHLFDLIYLFIGVFPAYFPTTLPYPCLSLPHRAVLEVSMNQSEYIR